MRNPITVDDLHAYVDGQLTPARMVEVEAHLAAHPDARKRVEDYKLLNGILAVGLDPVLSEPVPAEHMATVVAPPRRRLDLVAAVAAAFAVGISGGWLTHKHFSDQRSIGHEIAQRTVAAYVVYAPEERHPVEVFADESEHLQTWLSNRMGMTFILPDLQGLGLTLVGGRMMAADQTPAALLMYEGRADRRVVVYVRNDLMGEDRTAPELTGKSDADVMVWRDGENGFGVSGDVTRAELSAIARAVRAQFTI